MKRSGMLIETLVTVLFLSLALAVAVPCLVSASLASRRAYATDVAIVEVQSLADRISASKGLGWEPGAQVRYDRDMEPCGEAGHAYVLEIGEIRRDGYLGTAEVRMRDAGGGELFAVTASWQEEAYHGQGE